MNSFLNNWFSRFKPQSGDKNIPAASGKKSIVSWPVSSDDDFDQFLVNWASSTGKKLTASSITRILEGADNGSPQEQAALFQSIQEKEPVITTHLQTRILAVLGCEWTVTADNVRSTQPPASPRHGGKASFKSDDARADEVKSIVSEAGFYGLENHLLSALSNGYSGSAIVWSEGGGGIKEFKPVHPSNWIFDMAGNPALLGIDGKEHPLSEYHPNQFIFHTHMLKPGIPSTGGLLRPLVWLYFFKHYGLRDRARYLERFGIPFVTAKISRDDFENDTIKNQILQSLSRMGSDGVGVVTQDSEISVDAPPAGSTDAYDSWFKYIDDIYALLILGQLASSKEASGLSKGQMQENVRDDILKADCTGLAETLNKQLVRPLENFKWGTKNLVLKIECDNEDLEKKAAIVKTLADAGYKADRDFVQKKFNMPLQPEEKTQPVSVPAQTEKNKRSLSDTGHEVAFMPASRENYIASLTENTLDRLFKTESPEAMATFYGPLQSEIRKVFADINTESPTLVADFKKRVKTFFDAYPEIYHKMDSSAFETALSEAMLSAAVNGRHGLFTNKTQVKDE